MNRTKLTVIILGAAVVAALSGCGGGGASSGGKLSFSVVFPQRAPSGLQAALPFATNSIRIQVLKPGTLTPIVPDTILVRQEQYPQPTRVVLALPAGPVLVRAFAYASYDATGQVIARAESRATVAAGQTTYLTMIAEALVVRVELYPPSIEVFVGEQAGIEATCYDADGNIVLANLNWSSDDESVVSLPEDGLLLGVGPGQTSVHATEPISGVSSTAQVDVAQGAPPNEP